MSVSLSAERDRIQRQVEELEKSLSATHTELELLSSETDDESDDDTKEEAGEPAAGLWAQREKIQKEIQNLENVLGPICVSDDSSSSSEESELDLSPSVDLCLQVNLVYQQVVQETLDQLETLLTQNHRQQKDVMSQLSGPIKESSREQQPASSCRQPSSMFLGRFLKPYFKDKLTGLGPPANQETKEKASRMTGCLDNKKLKIKRWESWQKTLLIHSVSRDSLRRLIQPKLSKVDYLSQKLSSAGEADRQKLREQIDSLEREIDLLRGKKEDELIGDRFDEHDWQKISNIDFEGTRDAEDIRSFWQNFLHPSVRKTRWSPEELQQLKQISSRHGERQWEAIAAELGTGRTAFLCLQTFQRFVSGSLRRGSWTPAEDALLRELVDKMRIGNFIPYTQMSYFMEGRDPGQLIYRWNQVLDPSLKKGPWTKQEDELLLQAVSRFGEKNWWKIRLEVPGRSDSACRDRYHDCLKADTKRGPFDKQERDLLLQLVEKHGVGRWAKIAAEIPHRYDAQCLREWRKLSKAAAAGAQKQNNAKKPPKTDGGEKKVGQPQKRIRRRLMKLKEEEELEEKEEEELVVQYMDSDEEEKKKEEVAEVKSTEVEKEEEVQEYIIPPLQEWIPTEAARCFSSLNFRPVELPSSSDAHGGKAVRSTILGQCGRSVIIGPQPREMRGENRHSSSTMMMVSPDQLQAHLHRQANKFNSLRCGAQGKISKHNPPCRVTDTGLGYELQAAVTPWIGNLLIPAKTRVTAADALRERGEKMQLSSTPIFLLLLQTMNVDSVGCKEMIEQRSSRLLPLSPPLQPPSLQAKTPKTIAKSLQQSEVKQDFDMQHRLILTQLQALRQQQKQTPPPHLHLAPPHSRPGFLLQMLPNSCPQMSPVSSPQHVFVPHPAFQLLPSSLLTAPPLPPRTPPVGVVASLSPAPLTPHRLNVPFVCQLPLLRTSTPTCSTPPAALPGHKAAPPPPSCPDQPCPDPSPSGSVQNPLKSKQKVAEDQGALCAGQSWGVDVGGACTSVDGSRDSPIEEGRRIRKPSLKAKALQEASEAKAKSKKKAASSSQKRAQTLKSQTAMQLPPTPPAAPHRFPVGIVSSPLNKTETFSLPPPPAHESTSPPPPPAAAPACSDRTVSSTQHLPVASPPPMSTAQHTASSTSSLHVSFHSDHDYTLSQPSSAPPPPNPKHCISGPAPKKPPKATPTGRKRGRGASVTSGQAGDTAGGTGAGPDVIQEGKRIRRLSHRAKALQEASQAKAQSKTKRKSSSPRRKQPRTLCRKEDQPLSQVCLLPGQSVWLMSPAEQVQQAPSAPPAPPGNVLTCASATSPVRLAASCVPSVGPAVFTPVNLRPLDLAPPTYPPKTRLPGFIMQTVTEPSSCPQPPFAPQPPPKLTLPYKGTIRADPAAPPPLRKEELQFDPSLMFRECQAAVCDWLSGRGGVVVPGLDVALPYLPPFVSNLSTLSALLHAKTSLATSSLRLLRPGSEPRHPQNQAGPQSSVTNASSQTSDLPDSTSDLRDKPAPSVRPELLQQEQAELLVTVRQLVAERFSDNPAYQLLKARFLSCFTVPALLATLQPITAKTVAHPADEEEEKEKEVDEEEKELVKIKERGRQRRAKRSLLLCNESGAPANHFSGIVNTTDGAGLNQENQPVVVQ